MTRPLPTPSSIQFTEGKKTLLFSERNLREEYAEKDPRVLAVIDRLGRMRHALNVGEPCRTCGGVGSTPGFWLGTIKKCVACSGRGRLS